MKCGLCGKKANKAGVINGVFYSNLCTACIMKDQRIANAGSAQYSRDRDREDHLRDMIQPWVNGKPNPEFIREYPEYAKDNFTKEEIEQNC